jgi:glycosyltransferase involved in cell wall biosynthesis
MPMSTPEVSVIVPTLALPERRQVLHRALASVFGQEGIRCRALVVVNGDRFDRNVVRELAGDPRIRLIEQEQADLPAAYRLGRRHVATPWFTSLDDDDLLLPGALHARVRALQQSQEHNAVVTNGLRRGPEGDTPVVSDMAAVAADPLGALIRSNWLLPGAWLCRTDDASADLFDGMPRHLECTYLAVRLVTTRRVRFINDPTVVWHSDTRGSASKSRSFMLGQPAALRRILELDLPPDVRHRFRSRLGSAYHASSALQLESGRVFPAWKLHVRSLLEPGGWRRLSFTSRLTARTIGMTGRSA